MAELTINVEEIAAALEGARLHVLAHPRLGQRRPGARGR